MKKNKKLTFCGLVLACACLLCACGSKKNNTTQSPDTMTSTESSSMENNLDNDTTYDHTQSTDSLNDHSIAGSLAPTESTSDGVLGDAIDDAGHTVGDLIDDAADGVSNVADDLLGDGDAASRERP